MTNKLKTKKRSHAIRLHTSPFIVSIPNILSKDKVSLRLKMGLKYSMKK